MTYTRRRWWFVVSVLLGFALENARRRWQERRQSRDLGAGETHLHTALDRLWRG